MSVIYEKIVQLEVCSVTVLYVVGRIHLKSLASIRTVSGINCSSDSTKIDVSSFDLVLLQYVDEW